MKKTNKILAKALVIILSLVLITSCVVSSTFAKYVVSKSASTTVSLQKFGLTVTLDPIDGLKNNSNGSMTKKGDSITYTLNNVTLVPGYDTYKNLFRIASVTGTPSVDAILKINVTITGAKDKYFNISSDNFSTLTGKYGVYNPLTLYVAGEPVNSGDVYKPLSGTVTDTSTIFKTEVESKLESGLAAKAADATTDAGMTLEANKAVSSNLNNLNIGFAWLTPDSIDGVDCLDEITTWLSNSSAIPSDKTNSFTITYTISVEQKTGN